MRSPIDRPFHTREFRRRRSANWLTLGFTYAAMYMGRYNLSFANKALADTYGWDKTQIGTIITAALTIYGLSAIFGSMIQSGRALIFVIGGIAVMLLPWQWVFFIPAGIMTLMGFLTLHFVRDSPEEAGQPPFDTADASSGDTEKVNMRYLLKKVLANPVTMTIAAAEFCT